MHFDFGVSSRHSVNSQALVRPEGGGKGRGLKESKDASVIVEVRLRQFCCLILEYHTIMAQRFPRFGDLIKRMEKKMHFGVSRRIQSNDKRQ